MGHGKQICQICHCVVGAFRVLRILPCRRLRGPVASLHGRLWPYMHVVHSSSGPWIHCTSEAALQQNRRQDEPQDNNSREQARDPDEACMHMHHVSDGSDLLRQSCQASAAASVDVPGAANVNLQAGCV